MGTKAAWRLRLWAGREAARPSFLAGNIWEMGEFSLAGVSGGWLVPPGCCWRWRWSGTTWWSTAGTVTLPLGIFISVNSLGKFPVHTVGNQQEWDVGALRSDKIIFMRLHQPQQTRFIAAQTPFLPLGGWRNTRGAAPEGGLHIPALGWDARLWEQLPTGCPRSPPVTFYSGVIK